MKTGVPFRELVACGSGAAWRDLLVEIYRSAQAEVRNHVPGVPEPHIVYILQGTILFEERDPEGEWRRLEVKSGDLFLTTSFAPYEARWKRNGPDPLVALSVFVGLPLLAEATRDLLGPGAQVRRLREFSGEADPELARFLDQLRGELSLGEAASPMLVQGIARALAVHLVRRYGEVPCSRSTRSRGLTVFDLHRVDGYLRSHLDEEVPLAELAGLAGMSEFHFSRVFKRAAGLSPARYFIRLRMERARELLGDPTRNILEVGLEVGYSSASHFANLFRRETGLTPTEYRRSLSDAKA
ncbi:hypothetical protein ABS71_16660 [bacterium SCN 62-11]|nr:helix-turn-helix transcriptional regulator [Candidatus Eremiobacteraeota bacterium]ODT61816.1 MAG: hypothetical protein ABS71_16660 [bacterium SCN 62-11]